MMTAVIRMMTVRTGTTFNNKGKKVTDDKKKINGKTYYFNTDGEMRYGWFEDNGDWYYLGTEDEGWRTDAKWLWLEEPE